MKGKRLIPKQFNCIICNTVFITFNTNQKTCSELCRKIHNRELHRLRSIKYREIASKMKVNNRFSINNRLYHIKVKYLILYLALTHRFFTRKTITFMLYRTLFFKKKYNLFYRQSFVIPNLNIDINRAINTFKIIRKFGSNSYISAIPIDLIRVNKSSC